LQGFSLRVEIAFSHSKNTDINSFVSIEPTCEISTTSLSLPCSVSLLLLQLRLRL